MRLIDADALAYEILSEYGVDGGAEDVNTIYGMVVNAPTISEAEADGDLISRADAITRFCEFGTGSERDGKLLMTMVDAKYAFIETLESLPIVEVVRCKDCKHWNDWGLGAGTCERSENGYFWFGTDFNDFCSFGERGEE